MTGADRRAKSTKVIPVVDTRILWLLHFFYVRSQYRKAVLNARSPVFHEWLDRNKLLLKNQYPGDVIRGAYHIRSSYLFKIPPGDLACLFATRTAAFIRTFQLACPWSRGLPQNSTARTLVCVRVGGDTGLNCPDSAARDIRGGWHGRAISVFIEVNQTADDGFDVVHEGDGVSLEAGECLRRELDGRHYGASLLAHRILNLPLFDGLAIVIHPS